MAKRSKQHYYAVAIGRRSGVYSTWAECEAQVKRFSGNNYMSFDTRAEVAEFVRLYRVGDGAESEDGSEQAAQQQGACIQPSSTSISGINRPRQQSNVKLEGLTKDDDVVLMPPPASQSYFAQFANFKPNDEATFEDEFDRCASSEGLVPGTQQYQRERTVAIRDELKYHYSTQTDDVAPASQTTEDDQQQPNRPFVYQNMCREVGLEPHDTISECTNDLSIVLVNVIDYIDARRTGTRVKVWPQDEFEAFKAYTLHGDKRIHPEEAKADGGFLAVLLRKLVGDTGPPRPRRRKREPMTGYDGSNVVSGRVKKRVTSTGSKSGLVQRARECAIGSALSLRPTDVLPGWQDISDTGYHRRIRILKSMPASVFLNAMRSPTEV